jgi:hypothetical protein
MAGRGHREPASQRRPVPDQGQVVIGVRARQETQTRGGPEPQGAAPLISQALKIGVTVHLVIDLARSRPCGSGRSMRVAGPAHGRSLGSQGSRHHPAQKQRLGSRSGNGSVRCRSWTPTPGGWVGGGDVTCDGLGSGAGVALEGPDGGVPGPGEQHRGAGAVLGLVGEKGVPELVKGPAMPPPLALRDVRRGWPVGESRARTTPRPAGRTASLAW